MLGGYYLRRIAILIITVLLASVVVFIIIRSIPGDPVLIMMGEGSGSPEDYARLQHYLGLDQPVYIQYFLYLQRLLIGDWGHSLFGNSEVLPIVVSRFINTMELTGLAMFISVLSGTLLGIVSALKRGSRLDAISRFISIGGYSVPVFWMGILLMILFALNLHLLPAMGSGHPEYLILPSLTLAISSIGFQARIARASMLDVMGEEYVTTAIAKGLPKNRVILRHILRNALIPIVTITGIQFGQLLGGAVVTETVFNYSGLGKLLVDSIIKRDYPLVQAGLLVSVAAFCFINFAIDMLYTYLDPRIRYERKR